MHLDLALLESFVVLVQERHYGRAAALRHVAAPTLSKQIQRLERQVGAMLVRRDSSGVVDLTPAGARLAARAESLLAHELMARQVASGAVTEVVLGVPSDGEGGRDLAGLAVVNRMLRRQLPDTVVRFRNTPLPLMTASLLAHEVDVQLAAGPVRDHAVASHPLGAVTRVAAVPAASELGSASEVRIEDFHDRPMLYEPSLPAEFMTPFWLGDVRPARDARLVSIVARDSRTVLEQVVRGAGVTVLLPWQQSTVPAGVRVLPLLGAPPTLLHAATRLGDHRTVIGMLVTVLRAVLAHQTAQQLQAV